MTVSQSTLSGNSTTGNYADGGAIYALNGAVTVSQSTLSGNSTAGINARGGAIFAVFGAVTVSQSTLTGNQATLSAGGGIYSIFSPITIQNSIIAGNTDNGTAPDILKSRLDALTVSHSLIGDNTGTDLGEAQIADTSGNTGLHRTYRPEIAELLLKHKAPTETKNTDGETPLIAQARQADRWLGLYRGEWQGDLGRIYAAASL